MPGNIPGIPLTAVPFTGTRPPINASTPEVPDITGNGTEEETDTFVETAV